jgi:hypothetical protein
LGPKNINYRKATYVISQKYTDTLAHLQPSATDKEAAKPTAGSKVATCENC